MLYPYGGNYSAQGHGIISTIRYYDGMQGISLEAYTLLPDSSSLQGGVGWLGTGMGEELVFNIITIFFPVL